MLLRFLPIFYPFADQIRNRLRKMARTEAEGFEQFNDLSIPLLFRRILAQGAILRCY